MIGLFTILLSLNGVDFKPTTLLCSENEYTFAKVDVKGVGIRNNGNNYFTKFEDADSLDTELNKQCKKKNK